MENKAELEIKSLDKNFKNGLLRIMILKIIERKEMHAYAIYKEIQSNKKVIINVSKNDIYNSIASMEKLNMIVSKLSNKNQKVLVLTKKGKDVTVKFRTIMKRHMLSLKKLMVEFNE
ncbi:MAG: PadR family transcriptional regulator [Candidatus Micrarchaeia archaeon]